jgi:hypothetical protein
VARNKSGPSISSSAGVRPSSVCSRIDRAKPASASVGDIADHHLDPPATLASQFIQTVRAAGGRQHLRPRLVQHAREPRAQARRGAGHHAGTTGFRTPSLAVVAVGPRPLSPEDDGPVVVTLLQQVLGNR